jgi:hypothetical protein
MPEEIIQPEDQPPLFLRSYETSKLAEVLSKMEPGDMVSYAALSEACSVDVAGTSYQLRSAREIVSRENNIVTEPVYGQGIRRLTNGEIVNAATKGAMLISRRAKKEGEKLSKSDFAALDDAARRKYATHASVFGAIALMSSNRGVKAIEAAVTGLQRELPIKETLALFSE